MATVSGSKDRVDQRKGWDGYLSWETACLTRPGIGSCKRSLRSGGIRSSCERIGVVCWTGRCCKTDEALNEL
jgi:hypothetical protein